MSKDKYPKNLEPETVGETEVQIEKRGKNKYRATWETSNHGKFTSTAGDKERFLEILKQHRGSDLK